MEIRIMVVSLLSKAHVGADAIVAQRAKVGCDDDDVKDLEAACLEQERIEDVGEDYEFDYCEH